jgi:hypothetical protein
LFFNILAEALASLGYLLNQLSLGKIRHARPPCLTLCTLRAPSQTKRQKCHHGMTSTRANMERRVRAGMRSTKTEAQSKKGEAAGLPLRRGPPQPKMVRGTGAGSLQPNKETTTAPNGPRCHRGMFASRAEKKGKGRTARKPSARGRQSEKRLSATVAQLQKGAEVRKRAWEKSSFVL